jgi:toxin FitB
VIILDTNVIAEVVSSKADPKVLQFIDGFEESQVFTTSITFAELYYGVLSMPLGKRRAELNDKYGRLFDGPFLGKVLPFGLEAARIFAEISSKAHGLGNNLTTEDLQIAAIALHFGFPVASRNTKDFQHEDLHVINPWTDYAP